MSLIPINKSHLKTILIWRNSEVVRYSMFSQQKISWEEHVDWFKKIYSSQLEKWFLYIDEKRVPSGVVYFKEIDVNKKADWGFYANPEAESGTGMRMSLEAINYAFFEMGLEKIESSVLISNQRSIAMHEKVGFSESNGIANDARIRRFNLFSKDWPFKEKVLRRNIEEQIKSKKTL
jgi:UDP-4-amino-4,6-dideoxy-N-acetyl-beta-L-altrosamine N-acetyltransferase